MHYVHDLGYCLVSAHNSPQPVYSVFSGNWTTGGYTNTQIANSWTGQLVEWTSSRLDGLRTGRAKEREQTWIMIIRWLPAYQTAS